VALAIVGTVFDDGSEDVAMHDWMIGLGFIVLLVTPCLIAMWRGVESDEGCSCFGRVVEMTGFW
jgi:hypothetical protein